MKISVSLPDDDVRFLDDYTEMKGLSSRSAVLHRAVRLLRASELGFEYAAAWSEWKAEEEVLWDSTTSDGLH
jgi:Arc/MetJ-type ribon-helix-helix transcriptional regulator